MTEVHELMSPVEACLLSTQSLSEAAGRIVPGGAVVVLGLSHRPVGLITESDLRLTSEQDPQGWMKRRCAYGMRPVEDGVRTDDPIEGVLWRYRQGETLPMPVLNGDAAVGVLYPSAVFQWCAERQPSGRGHAAQPADDAQLSETQSA